MLERVRVDESRKNTCRTGRLHKLFHNPLSFDSGYIFDIGKNIMGRGRIKKVAKK